MSFFKNNSPYIIAEIASAHEGNPDLAIELLNFASKRNADAVKFQIFKTEKLLSIQNPHYNEFKEIELSSDDWKKVDSEPEVKSVQDNTEQLPDHLANALNKDYSEVLKKVDEKAKFKNGA